MYKRICLCVALAIIVMIVGCKDGETGVDVEINATNFPNTEEKL